jgi:purine-binding chemotaxis protein CheW
LVSVSAALAGSGPAPEPQAPPNLLQFRLEGRRCGVDASAVVEILAAVATTPLPHQADYIAGIIDLRGAIIPVLDLRARFGIPSRPMELSDQLIVVRAHTRVLALWVDAVETLGACDAAAWSPTGGLIIGDRSLAGVVSGADGIAIIHDVGEFVAQCEADAVFEAAVA